MSEPLTLTDVIHKARHQYEGEEPRHIFCGDIAQEVERWLAARVAPSDGLREAIIQNVAIAIVSLPNSGGVSWNEAESIGVKVAALATTGQPVDGLREAAHCDDHIVYQGACWKCLERAGQPEPERDPVDEAHARGFREGYRLAEQRAQPEDTRTAEYHGHEQEVCEPCWKAGHDVGDTRTADPGGLREAVEALPSFRDREDRPWPWVNRRAVLDIIDAIVPTPEATAPGLDAAWAEAEDVVYWDWTLRLTRLVKGGYRAEAIAGDEVKVYTVASDPDAALRELSDVITESHVND
jgi:hypothetical protein